jgi:hypothetical protein
MNAGPDCSANLLGKILGTVRIGTLGAAGLTASPRVSLKSKARPTCKDARCPMLFKDTLRSMRGLAYIARTHMIA